MVAVYLLLNRATNSGVIAGTFFEGLAQGSLRSADDADLYSILDNVCLCRFHPLFVLVSIDQTASAIYDTRR